MDTMGSSPTPRSCSPRFRAARVATCLAHLDAPWAALVVIVRPLWEA